MAGNLDLIIAGIAGGAPGNAFARFAAVGTPLPAVATDPLDVAFLDPGLINADDGISKGNAVTSNQVNALGVPAPVRTIKSGQTATFSMGFLESGPIPLAIFHELPLDAIVPDDDGAYDFVEGPVRDQKYAMVIDVVDGVKLMRGVCPEVQVTDKQSFTIKSTGAVIYAVTVTAYPGSDLTAVHWMYLQPSLAA